MPPYNAEASPRSMEISGLEGGLKQIIKLIQGNLKEIQNILADYQPIRVTQYEIDHYMYTLANIDKIEKHLKNYVGINIASFLPSNLPLYSLLLFAIIPSYVAEKVVVRPNSALVSLASINKLFKILKLDEICPKVSLFLGSRDEYLTKYIAQSDFIIFTGRNETRELIKGSIKPGAYLVNNGSGHNPIVVTETAKIDEAVRGVTYSKFFNAGQDCAGPDAVLVHENVKVQFLGKLKESVSNLKVGNHHDSEVIVGKILGQGELCRFQNIINENIEDIVLGGEVDMGNQIVYPTIIEKSITNGKLNFSELFGPILFVYTFKNESELKLYFDDFDGKYMQNKMYLSIYSEKLSPFFTSKDLGILLHNKIILNKEIDNSFTAYGGFSRGASSITENKKGKLLSVATPVFLPETIRKIFVERRPLKDLVLPKRCFAPDRQKVHSIKKDLSLDFINGTRKILGSNLSFAFIYGGVTQDKVDCGIDAMVCLKEKNDEMEQQFIKFIEGLNVKCGLKTGAGMIDILNYNELTEKMYDLLHQVYGETSTQTSPENRLDYSFLWGSQNKNLKALALINHISILANDNKVGLTCENKKAVKIIAADAKKIYRQVQCAVERKNVKEDVNEPNSVMAKKYWDWDRKEIVEALDEMSGHWDSKCTR